MARIQAQRGVALLALVAVLTLGISWYLVSALNTATQNATVQQKHDALVLRQAKEALIGWVARQAYDATEAHPGRLPCPESLSAIGNSAEEGTSPGNCTLPAAGRLPWKTLGIEQPKDASGEPLWYVVSTGWTLPYSTAALALNSNTQGNLALDGQANAAAALIIAPGAALPVPASANCGARAQSRSTTALDVRDYLECQNAIPANGTFVSTGPSGSFNDRVVPVTAKDIWSIVEAVVAKRIERDVVPQLQGALYSSATWGGSAAAPIYPYPARFRNDAGTFNPEAFQGRRYSNDGNTVAQSQGLLPVSASTCNTLTAARCDATFVRWLTTGILVTKTTFGGPTWSYDCSSSTSSVLRCVIDYSCGGFCLGSMGLRVQATALNVGMALRTIDVTQVTGITSVTVPSATLGANGSAAADVRGTLGYFCNFGGCYRPAAATIVVPIGLFTDHPFIAPASTDAWYWFFENDWQLATYYAVAPAHLPSGTHDCSTSAPCITVNVAGAAALPNRQAILVLAGRSLSGAARPNGTLTDFLDTAENANGDTTFEHNRANSVFNDRVVTVANY